LQWTNERDERLITGYRIDPDDLIVVCPRGERTRDEDITIGVKGDVRRPALTPAPQQVAHGDNRLDASSRGNPDDTRGHGLHAQVNDQDPSCGVNCQALGNAEDSP
jgi:hypothetical protein